MPPPNAQPQRRLLAHTALDRSGVVANCTMNRGRGIDGPNSYARDLGFDLLGFLAARLALRPRVSWLDLCCGSGRALIEAAGQFAGRGLSRRLSICGLDLVPMFDPVPPGIEVELRAASLPAQMPAGTYDLITCVHGLHYVGDKLGLIARAAAGLARDGLFIANLDLSNLCLTDGKTAPATFSREFRRAGLTYDRKRRTLRCDGKRLVQLSYLYFGADDAAGPNSTGQPAVDSYYRRK